MSETHRNQPTAADVFALATALERDQGLPSAELVLRDRRIGRSVTQVSGKSAETTVALAWLDTVCAEDAALRRHHRRVGTLLTWTGALTAAIGLILGWVAALGVLYYDGSGRVNALAVLAAFIVVPTFFLFLFAWAAVPTRLLGWLPGANAASALLRAISPGRLAGLIMRFFPRETRDTWHQLTHWLDATEAAHGELRKWIVLRTSQLFALGFQFAALLATLAFVVFSDLAFGWSTTLTTGDATIDAQRLTAITDSLAAPWGNWLEQARPSAELIRDSRYFRAARDSLSHEQAARLGGWWPFLMMAMLTYGLLPRLVTLWFAHIRVRSTARRAFLAEPGLGPVLRRLHQSRVETVSHDPEYDSEATSARALARAAADRADGVPASAAAVINWSAVPIDDRRLSERFGGVPVHHAGGSAEPESDRTLGGRIAGSMRSDDGLVIFVKAWEPPLMEFIDFVGELRRACGRDRTITIVPIGVRSPDGGDAQPFPYPERMHREVWRRKLASAGDPRLRLATPEPEDINLP